MAIGRRSAPPLHRDWMSGWVRAPEDTIDAAPCVSWSDSPQDGHLRSVNGVDFIREIT
jgi:hypothetical protein